MISKRSRIRLSSEDMAHIIGESKTHPHNGRGSRERRSSPLGGLLWGDAEMLEPRPGLRIYTSDFRLENELEVTTAKPDQPMFCSVLTVAGSWRLQYRDRMGRSEELSVTAPSNVAGLSPSETYKTTLRGGRRHRYFRVDISTALLREWTGEAKTNNGMNHGASSQDLPAMGNRGTLIPALECLAHDAARCPMEEGARRFFMEGKALEVIAHELHYSKVQDPLWGETIDPAEMERLHRAKSILEMEYADPPGLFELARKVGLNDFKLKRGFKKHFGTTVFGYIRDLRMEKARALLMSGEMSVIDAAAEAGYLSLGHFAAAFRRRFGILPGKYRKARSRPRL